MPARLVRPSGGAAPGGGGGYNRPGVTPQLSGGQNGVPSGVFGYRDALSETRVISVTAATTRTETITFYSDLRGVRRVLGVSLIWVRATADLTLDVATVSMQDRVILFAESGLGGTAYRANSLNQPAIVFPGATIVGSFTFVNPAAGTRLGGLQLNVDTELL